LRLFSFGGYGLALAALALVVFGAIECPPIQIKKTSSLVPLQGKAQCSVQTDEFGHIPFGREINRSTELVKGRFGICILLSELLDRALLEALICGNFIVARVGTDMRTSREAKMEFGMNSSRSRGLLAGDLKGAGHARDSRACCAAPFSSKLSLRLDITLPFFSTSNLQDWKPAA